MSVENRRIKLLAEQPEAQDPKTGISLQDFSEGEIASRIADAPKQFVRAGA